MTHFANLTRKQYELLGRMIRLEQMPVSRYRVETASFSSLLRKLLAVPKDGTWHPTQRGRDVYAALSTMKKVETSLERTNGIAHRTHR